MSPLGPVTWQDYANLWGNDPKYKAQYDVIKPTLDAMGITPQDITDPEDGTPEPNEDPDNPDYIGGGYPIPPVEGPATGGNVSTGPWNQPGVVTQGDTNAYDKEIEAAAKKYGLDMSLIKAVIQQESKFDPLACSPTGCKGLMQLSPDKGTDDQFRDAATNIDLGAKFLKEMIDLAGGDIRKGLAMYNAGPNADLDGSVAGQDHSGYAYADKVLALQAQFR
jgi:hypothetical protein